MSSITVDNLKRMYLALMPKGPIWNAEPEGDADKFFEGLANGTEDIVDFFDSLASARDPYKTQYLDDLEYEYGVSPRASATEDERREYLASVVYNRKSRGTADDLQERLRDAGFDVYVYTNNPVRDPAQYYGSGYITMLGGTNAYIGDPGAQLGYLSNSGVLIVNGTQYHRKEQSYDAQLGSPYVCLGSPIASLGFYIAEDVQEEISYILPVDRQYWPYVFFIGGATSGWDSLDDWDMELPGVAYWPAMTAESATEKDTSVQNSGFQSLKVTAISAEDQEVFIDISDPDIQGVLLMHDVFDGTLLTKAGDAGDLSGDVSNTICAAGRALNFVNGLAGWDTPVLGYNSDFSFSFFVQPRAVGRKQYIFNALGNLGVRNYSLYLDESFRLFFEDENLDIYPYYPQPEIILEPNRLYHIGLSCDSFGSCEWHIDGLTYWDSFTPAISQVRRFEFGSVPPGVDSSESFMGLISFPVFADAEKNDTWFSDQVDSVSSLANPWESGAYTERAIDPTPISATAGVHNLVNNPSIRGVNPTVMLDGRDGAEEWQGVFGAIAKETESIKDRPVFGRFGEFTGDRATAITKYTAMETSEIMDSGEDRMLSVVFKPGDVSGEATIAEDFIDGVVFDSPTNVLKSGTDLNPIQIDGVFPTMDYRGADATETEWVANYGVNLPHNTVELGVPAIIQSALCSDSEVTFAELGGYIYHFPLGIYSDYSLGMGDAVFEVWFTMSRDNSFDEFLIGNTTSMQSGWGFSIPSGSRALSVRLSSGSYSEVFLTSSALEDNCSYCAHVVVNRSVNEAYLYINGVLEDTQDISTVGQLSFYGVFEALVGVDFGMTRATLWKGVTLSEEGVLQRFYRAVGVRPYKDLGDSPETEYTTGDSGYITVEHGGGVAYKKVSSGWPRMSVKDGNFGILAESGATNILPRCLEMNTWTTSQASATTGHRGPDGTLRACGLVSPLGVSGTHILYRTFSCSAGVTYKVSGFLKQGAQDWVRILLSEGANNSYVYLDFSTGITGTTVGNISNVTRTPYYDGWCKFELDWAVITGGTGTFHIYGAEADNDNNYVGTGTEDVYLFGVNISTQPVELIDTAASPVTRSPDYIRYKLPYGMSVDYSGASIKCNVFYKKDITATRQTVFCISDDSVVPDCCVWIDPSTETLNVTCLGTTRSVSGCTPEKVHSVELIIATASWVSLDGVLSSTFSPSSFLYNEHWIGIGVSNYWAGGTPYELNGIVSDFSIAENSSGGRRYGGLRIYRNGSDICGLVRDPLFTGESVLSYSASLSSDEWYKVDLVHSSTYGSSLYLNGVLVDSDATAFLIYEYPMRLRMSPFANNEISFVATYREDGLISSLDESTLMTALYELYSEGETSYRRLPIRCFLWGGGVSGLGVPVVYAKDAVTEEWILIHCGSLSWDRQYFEAMAPRGASAIRLMTKFVEDGFSNFDDLAISDPIIETVQIPLSRWDEFRRIVLKTKPVRSWAIAMVERV